MWPFAKKPEPKPLWVYTSHDRIAVDAAKNAHVYLVTFKCGFDERQEEYHFHAASLEPKNEKKLVAYFRQQSNKLNGV